MVKIIRRDWTSREGMSTDRRHLREKIDRAEWRKRQGGLSDGLGNHWYYRG